MKKIIIAVALGCLISCADDVNEDDACSKLYDQTLDASKKMKAAEGTPAYDAAADDYWALRRQYAQQCR